jgi:hypothetical protein
VARAGRARLTGRLAMLLLGADWHVGQVLWSILWFTMFFIFIWLLFIVFADIFRSHDMSGWAKALWVIGIIILPFLGILVYLIARGGSMHERSVQQARTDESQLRQYVRQVAGPPGGTAGELAKLADLKARGVISDAEFDQLKAQMLAPTA